MTKNKITEGNAFSLCINQAVWVEIGGEETPIPANELEDVHLYIGRGPYKAKATEYQVMASGDKLIAYIDHTLKVGMYSTWITAYCNGRRVASNCKEAFEIVSFDEHCSNVVNEVYVCPAIYLQGTVAADEAIRQMQEAERVEAEAERKKTFDAIKASFVAFLAESKEQWDAWMDEVRQAWTSWFDAVKTEWQTFFEDATAKNDAMQQQEEVREAVTSAAIASLDERDKAYAQNELSREDAELGRVQEEKARSEAESERQQHEEVREAVTAAAIASIDEREIAYEKNELYRADAERVRVQEEQHREANEDERVLSESIREAAEEQRTNTFNTNEANREQTFQENENRRDEVVAAAIASINERIMAAS